MAEREKNCRNERKTERQIDSSYLGEPNMLRVKINFNIQTTYQNKMVIIQINSRNSVTGVY
jgi:hypothetical protein